jgi:hypothetical protein
MAPKLAGETPLSTGHFLHLVARRVEARVMNEDLHAANINRWRRAPIHHFRNFMDRMVRVMGTQTLLVIVDEFQTLGELEEEGASRDEVFLALRSLVQHGASVNFLFSGGGVLTELRRRSRLGSLLATVDAVPMGHLLPNEAEELLHLRPTDMRFSAAAVVEMIALTAAHPYYLQLLGTRLDALGHRNIDADQVEAARASVVADRVQGMSTVEHYWQLGRKSARGAVDRMAILATVAAHAGAGGLPFGALVAQLGRDQDEAALAHEVDALRAYGSLRDQADGLGLPVPLVAQWLAANYPPDRVRLLMKEKRSR